MLHRLRLFSGLVMLVFVTGHLINHAAGIVSLDAMNAGLKWSIAPWRTVPGLIVLAGAFAVHLATVLVALFRRRTWRMPLWEAAQIALGLAIPLLLVEHVVGTRVANDLLGTRSDYALVVAHYWAAEPGEMIRQIALVVVAWAHGMMGVHYWARLKPGYRQAAPWLLAVAVTLPVLAIAGFAAAGTEMARAAAADSELVATIYARARFDQAVGDSALAIAGGAETAYWALIGGILAARIGTSLLARRFRIRVHLPDGRTVSVDRGATVLESLRRAGVAHASVCGGRGRCSTCRVMVRRSARPLAEPEPREARVLARIAAPEGVRLACQIRPAGDLAIQPLMPPGVAARAGAVPAGVRLGEEREIAILFADLRGFTRLAESRLPFDVVYLLNRYFEEMGRAIEQAGGRIDKFIGDGIMALFGVERGAADGSRRAVAAAGAMGEALARLNQALAADLPAPLRMGLGLHVGSVVVGEIGYGRVRGLTAIGDAVNLASRLEQATKEHGAEAVVSLDLLARAGLADDAERLGERREIAVRGRQAPLQVVCVDRAADLAAAVDAPVS